jgi:hypothetical protein
MGPWIIGHRNTCSYAIRWRVSGHKRAKDDDQGNRNEQKFTVSARCITYRVQSRADHNLTTEFNELVSGGQAFGHGIDDAWRLEIWADLNGLPVPRKAVADRIAGTQTS